MSRLTNKKYWENNWERLNLPAHYPDDYSHKIIANKVLSIIKDNKIKIKKIVELGGCPGKWSDFFSTYFHCQCDVIDYGQNNCAITRKNYQILKISGKVFNEDIFNNKAIKKSYDVVLSDGLVEHFTKLDLVFMKHLKLLKPNGLLIIGVPNIKQSPFYNYFAKKDKEGYKGYRAVEAGELLREAKKHKVEILYCGRLGMINLGLIHWDFIKDKFMQKTIAYFFQFLNSVLSVLKIKTETKIFSPYIFLIGRKSDE